MKKVPNLRFKEFSDSWYCRKLNDILIDTRLGGNYKNTESITPFPLIKMGNLSRGHINLNKIEYITHDEVLNSDDILQKGDLLFNTRNTLDLVGKVAIWNNELELAYYNSNIMKLIFDSGQVSNNYFMNYLFNTKSSLSRLKSFATGTTSVAAIYTKDLKQMKIEIPSCREQEKIAAFFSLIDKKIELQTEKVEELKNYKKGLMQKIFSQELRFKDENGNEYPEWEEVNLRKILKEVSEKTTVINQYEVISSTNNGLYLQKDYFNREIASKDNIGYKILKRNQVVLSPQNLWMGNINLNSKYDIGMVSPSYKIFDIKSEFDSSYIGFILRTDRAFYEYKQASEQGASIVRRNLNMDLFYDVSFNLPCKAEQFKISKFINKIDCKIEQEVEKLESLNEYKKGLLQQMFI